MAIRRPFGVGRSVSAVRGRPFGYYAGASRERARRVGALVREEAKLGDLTKRRVFIDLSPLRRSRDMRCLVLGELVSVLGTQLTTVAVPYQVYQLTHSSLDVGLVSLAQPRSSSWLHRGRAAPGPPAARLPQTADAGTIQTAGTDRRHRSGGASRLAHAGVRAMPSRGHAKYLLGTGVSDTSNNAQG